MSNTFKTNKARLVRKLIKREIKTQRLTNDSEKNEVFKHIKNLEVNGVRYGNHRHMYALEKVKDRRIERRRLNRSVEE